jgi:ssDNA-binding Zn-finger/Zn-ribbon topoisomerase 1
MGGRSRTWTDSTLLAAVSTSWSLASVIRKLGLQAAGGNYATVGTRIRLLGLDTSHWTGQATWKGRKCPPVKGVPLSQLLCRSSTYQSNKLRRRLISEGILLPRCSACGICEWLGKPAPLELDHVDGDRQNNELDNLRLVCPNCHALTTTYRGRNIRRRGPHAINATTDVKHLTPA